MALKQTTSHIAIVPSPGISHLIPFVEFAKRLVVQHSNFHVTCIIPTNGPPSKATKAIVESLPTSNIDSIFLPPVSFDEFPEGTVPGDQIALTVLHSVPSLRRVLESLLSKTHLSAFLADFFGAHALDVADKEFNIPSFVYFPSPATLLLLILHAPKLDQKVSCDFKNLPEPVKIPGFIPIHGKDLPDPFLERKREMYKQMLRLSKRLVSVEGIVVNTFENMESGAIKALQEKEANGIISPPIFTVGPLVQSVSSGEDHHGSECLSWLDNQPRGTVLYVSFGSGGTLSHEQMKELALGLEMSGKSFLWVVNRPNDELRNAAYLSSGQGDFDPSEVLPAGFLERIKGRGLVVASWAPQIEILRHGSTGGFLTHCGWNSTLESVLFGKPLIAWPLFAEQKTNAVMLVDALKVALRPKANENGFVRGEEIARVVKDLIEGEGGKRLGKRMNDLKDAANRALGKDGSSTRALSELATKWQNVEAPK
nr:hydroquinone glucosyltransferase-like [Ziziphus jujuba var. spinosa]